MSRSSATSSAAESRGPNRHRIRPALAAVGFVGLSVVSVVSPTGAGAETLSDALAKAYFNNPNLNAQRSNTRAADENIPIANSGYMPHVTASGDVGAQYQDYSSPVGVSSGVSSTGLGTSTGTGTGIGTTGVGTSTTGVGTSTTGVGTSTTGIGTTGLASAVSTSSTSTAVSGSSASRISDLSGTVIPRGAGITVTQTLFDGLRTTNNIRSAESNVFGSRETLRNVEQSVLQSGAQSYMDVLRDTAILDLRNSNIKVLEEQLRQTQDRFKVGEVTRTDVAQAEASVAGSRADYFAAQSQLQNSIASFRQVIGEQPTRLEPARPLDRGIPPSLENAIAVSQIEHPSIQAALHSVDVAGLQVKIAEGALYPTLSLNGSAQQRYDVSNVGNTSVFAASIVGSLSVPIYEGGASYATIRQAKEQLGTAEFQVDVSRDNVRAAVISSWGLLVSSKAAVQADQAQVNAAEIALNGTREEARVGQRTTLDVLNAQQTLLNARVQLVGAQRDRVVATYAILASCGRLSASGLNLRLQPYNPTVHFDQVKDKWFGLRTPDGR
ncbi:TolC family outer membrane protein [Lichenibacterium ramalinae]|uniref:Channel protein TolC n=1 Tax=Lichenibacterium ramalinae TaxID=2316527 RepID=A0A4Q2RBW2_9HYPH|nr:TolC family outer membrane protein [Lichenibacterium ramalinae]RYB04931.1 channel protein TolC [Lichenibacterium ramalinae]